MNRMGNALAVAGQAAANQVFNTAFWMVSFLPSGEFIFCEYVCVVSMRMILCLSHLSFSCIKSLPL